MQTIKRLFGLNDIDIGLPIKVVVLGLDGAGKLTLLYKLKFANKKTSEIETIKLDTGINIDYLQCKNATFSSWSIWMNDVGFKRLTDKHMQNMDTLVFVVDSTNRNDIQWAAEYFYDVIQKLGTNIPVLLFANKQDLPSAMTATEVADKMRISSLNLKYFHVEPLSALEGVGLFEGLEWVVKTLESIRGNNTTESAADFFPPLISQNAAKFGLALIAVSVLAIINRS